MIQKEALNHILKDFLSLHVLHYFNPFIEKDY